MKSCPRWRHPLIAVGAATTMTATASEMMEGRTRIGVRAVRTDTPSSATRIGIEFVEIVLPQQNAPIRSCGWKRTVGKATTLKVEIHARTDIAT